MATRDDLQQQRDIGKAFREISDLRGAVDKLQTAIIGIDGKNGLRGELREFMILSRDSSMAHDRYIEALTERAVNVEDSFRHYIEVDRAPTCLGIKALAEFKASQHEIDDANKIDRRETDHSFIELKKVRMTMMATIMVALIGIAGSVATTILANRTNNSLIEQVEALP